ncbi:MAG: cysteine desulfurase [Verrucomicrobiaceae bacterium]|nr:cysteine desulfurase [Verrucomicrobiaceae bacterium]
MTYFDYNATTPMCAAAQEAWLKANRNHWYNASSLYKEAAATSQHLDAARERLAELLGCDAMRIVFTSGATEANNSLFSHFGDKRCHISAIEHPSVRVPARAEAIPVSADGILDMNHLPLQSDLVSVMAANNESGVIQPWKQIMKTCRDRGIAFHSDATQWIGKLEASELGQCDYLSGSAHKFGGPKGCGFLVLRDEEESWAFLRGGPQENRRRAGTENYPAIEAMVTALEHVTQRLPEMNSAHRDAFVKRVRTFLPNVEVVNEDAPRLWNTVMLVMPRHDNRRWLARLSQAGFAVSTGSACSSGVEGSSVVLQALGTAPDALKRTLRVSGGWDTTLQEWISLADAMREVLSSLDR